MKPRLLLLLLLFSAATSGQAASYRVGPGALYPTLQSIAGKLAPGDLVEVLGDAEYPGGVTFAKNGSPKAPITIRGVKLKGRRPVLLAVAKMPGAAIVRFTGSHYLFEGFELTAGGKSLAARGIYNVGDDVAILNCSVHDCPFNGVAGSDSSGSLTLSGVEIFRCGAGDRNHQVYVGSSNTIYPEAVFRMEFCFIHDGAGGNNVKSRVTRNEIYYNWIEGAYFHELDLIGADPAGQKGPKQVREDSDVVGNVLLKRPSSHGYVANIGGDNTGISNGRYRFVNNTIILPSGPAGNGEVFRLKNAVQSVEMHNNVFFRPQNQAIKVLNDQGLAPGVVYGKSGGGNWISNGAPPGFWTNTHSLKPGDLVDPEGCDFRPAGGLLASHGEFPTRSPAGLEFPMPLLRPEFAPPKRAAASASPVRREGKMAPGAY